MIQLILLQWIVVFIIDISGVVDTIKQKLSSLLTNGKIKTTNFQLRPFTCSLCMTFWTGLLFLVATNQFSLPYFAFVCLLSATVTLTRDTFYTFADLYTRLLNKINQLLS